jgi:2-polyprenyl-3-methyl-5-hydroxy-6-metoxy-1,4-benzoquinol methylase
MLECKLSDQRRSGVAGGAELNVFGSEDNVRASGGIRIQGSWGFVSAAGIKAIEACGRIGAGAAEKVRKCGIGAAMNDDYDKRLDAKLDRMAALVTKDQVPNINSLWLIAKDIEAIKLNIKFFGYELAQRLSEALPRRDDPLDPGPIGLRSKPSTQADMESDWVAYWAKRLGIQVLYHRKIWEFCYVLQALSEHGALRPGNRGLGFGCGQEPIPSLLASMGINVTVTDLETAAAKQKGWVASNQHAANLDSCFNSNLVDRSVFLDHVHFEYADMNAIPSHLSDYDFCWSICAFEHLGNISKGLDFVENSLKPLVSGGIAVHTTEFNFSNDEKTIDNWPTVLFQRKHFQEIVDRLRNKGHVVAELDFDVGSKPLDKFLDLPPFVEDFKGITRHLWSGGVSHLKLVIDGFPSTCFGLIVKKG